MVNKLLGFENIHYDKLYFAMRKVWREKLWLQESSEPMQDKNNDTEIEKPVCRNI